MIGVAIDPGLRGCGLAIFTGLGKLDQGVLIHASYVKNTALRGDDFQASREMADAVRRSIEAALYRCDVDMLLPVAALWAEVPISYEKAEDRKGSQQDLIHLAGFVYMIAGLSIFAQSTLIRYYPREWKGTIEKGKTKVDRSSGEITSDGMAGRIMDRLDAEEKKLIMRAGDLTHNIVDAIGIGLKGCGRLEQRRVYGVIE